MVARLACVSSRCVAVAPCSLVSVFDEDTHSYQHNGAVFSDDQGSEELIKASGDHHVHVIGISARAGGVANGDEGK